MVIKNLENKIKLVMIICSLFLILGSYQYLQYLDSPCHGYRCTAKGLRPRR